MNGMECITCLMSDRKTKEQKMDNRENGKMNNNCCFNINEVHGSCL